MPYREKKCFCPFKMTKLHEKKKKKFRQGEQLQVKLNQWLLASSKCPESEKINAKVSRVSSLQ